MACFVLSVTNVFLSEHVVEQSLHNTTLAQIIRITTKWIYTELKNFSPFTIFEQLALTLKTEFALNSLCRIYIFYLSGFLSHLRLPWKTDFSRKFSLYWNIFYHSGFLNMRLPENEFAPHFFTVLNNILSNIQDFWPTLRLPCKTEFVLKI